MKDKADSALHACTRARAAQYFPNKNHLISTHTNRYSALHKVEILKRIRKKGIDDSLSKNARFIKCRN